MGFCPEDGVALPAPVAALPDPLIGRVIDGRYRVESVLGEGGMGVVYAVTHAVLGKRFALKVLRGEKANDADTVARFVQEARSATTIGHPNIIGISDFGRLPDGTAYFVMEHLGGRSLTALMAEEGALPEAQALHVVRQIAAALGAAHAHGIFHRDLKPDNVQILTQGSDPAFVKVLDFGIAKVAGASSKLTKTGMVFGTPHYMSPEQASGQPVDERTDVYALGVIIHEIFTGHVPFDAPTFMGILSKHLYEALRSPSETAGRPLGAIEGVILRALAKKPEDRYPSMAALGDDLDAIAAGVAPAGGPAMRAVPATEVMPGAAAPWRGRQGPADGGSEVSRDTHREVGPEGHGSRRIMLIGLALGGLGLVGLVVAAAFFVLAGVGLDRPLAPTAPTASPLANPSPQPPPAPPASGVPTIVSVPPPAPEPAPGRIAILSEPSGAEVLVDGVSVGNTPFTTPALPPGQSVAVELRAAGHDPAHLTLGADAPASQRVVLVATSAARPAALPTRARRPVAPTSVSSSPSGAPRPAAPRPTEVVDPWGSP